MHIFFKIYPLASAIMSYYSAFAIAEKNSVSPTGSASTLTTVMTPYAVACLPGLFILSKAECFGTANSYQISKAKKTSSSEYPRGCSLNGSKMYYNTNQTGKPPGNQIRSICRTRELRDLPSPKRTLELCEGDCNSDSECSDDLSCFFTIPGAAEGIPGCGGGPTPNVDYCIRPEDLPNISCESSPPTPSG